ncbi:PAS domain-containing protein [Roseobacter sp.]|uniref:PAS domain-containing protein n=1 Tax=Roseobacter sp. TaxID=1907202 RepID=UPI003299D0F5
MLDTSSADKLAAILGQFSVPMFAADRASATSDFKVVCINQAHATASGLEPAALKGVSIRSILPRSEADILIDHYVECAHNRAPLRYLVTLTLPDGIKQWDTTIQHVPLASGGDRVVGTGLPLAIDAAKAGTQMTYDNVRYFSALADMQLQNLVSMFETAHQQGLFNSNSTSRVDQLCGICRTVQRSVEDIRETIRRADPHKPPTRAIKKGDVGESTLRALCETALAKG